MKNTSSVSRFIALSLLTVLLFGRTESGQEIDMSKKNENSVKETKQESSLSLLFKQLQDPNYGCLPFPGIEEEWTGPEIFVNVPCDETGARWDYSYKVTRELSNLQSGCFCFIKLS
jgi:hypothetical protein